jgi:hypothetical protein
MCEKMSVDTSAGKGERRFARVLQDVGAQVSI